MTLRITRKLFLSLAIVLLLATASGAWDAAGRWLIEGEGYGEKSFVRIRLGLEGTADLYTVASGDLWCVTSYDVDLTLRVSRLGINTWSDHVHEIVNDRIVLPTLEPTVNNPFELLRLKLDNGLTCRIRLTSATSGTVDLYGTVDIDVLGDTEFNTESVIWKQGTRKPYLDKDFFGSGCTTGLGGLFPFLLCLPFLFRKKRPPL